MKDPYSVLGVPPTATDEEIKNAYRNLARKYHPDNFTDDNPLKELAKEKMQEINTAYDDIQLARKKKKKSGSESGSTENSGYSSTDSVYSNVRVKISQSKFKEAESLLFSVHEHDRGAEWHFLYSVCLLQRGRSNEAMRELEIACTMDPGNEEYQRMKEMFNNSGNRYGSTYYDNRGYGRRSSTSDACDCCANLICLDCLCECFGGDLIRCI